jgi:hypothetical protein
VPALGQQFNVIPAAQVTGQFDIATMPTLPAGLFLNLTYDAPGVRVSVGQLQFLISLSLDSLVPLIEGYPIDSEVADMDNDGDLDLVLLLQNPAPEPHHIVIMENAGVDGGGQWLGFLPDPQTLSMVADLRSLSLGYLNGDAFIDVLVANYGAGAVDVYFNAADGGTDLVSAPSVIVGPFVNAVCAAPDSGFAVDFVVAGGSEGRVWHARNNGSGVFTLAQSFTGNIPLSVLLKDFDGDKAPDLLTVRTFTLPPQFPSVIEIRLYDPLTETFGDAFGVQAGLGTASCDVLDLNNDGVAEVVTADTNNGRLSVFIHNVEKPGTFESIFLPVGVEPRSLAARDLDADGDADLAFLASQSPGGERRLRVLRNDLTEGQLIFATAIDVSTGGEPLLIVADNIDLQAGLDVLAINGPASALAGGTAGSLGVMLSDAAPDPCPADTNNDGSVDVDDLIAVILSWGPCQELCAADVAPPGGNGQVDVDDLIAVILAWGRCQ